LIQYGLRENSNSIPIELPRLSDIGLFMHKACESKLLSFNIKEAFDEKEKRYYSELLESYPYVYNLIEIVQNDENPLKITMTDLIDKLHLREKGYNPKRLSNELKRIAPGLKSMNIVIEDLNERDSKGRMLKLIKRINQPKPDSFDDQLRLL
jgi:hypothetical protein